MRAWVQRRRWVLGLVAAMAAGTLAAGLVGGTAAANAEHEDPVPHGVAAGAAEASGATEASGAARGAAAEAAAPDVPPPGSNDWSCRPSPQHPNPVVLVHGLGANQTEEWQTLSPLLANEGWCVYSLTYGTLPGAPIPANQVGGLTRMQDSAAQLSIFVDRILAATHAQRVDLVGGSEGTVMPRWYIKHLGGAQRIERFVALAPLWQGTDLAGLATLNGLAERYGVSLVTNGAIDPACGSCRQLLRGSDYLADVNSEPAFDPRITYTAIVTRYDQLVMPYTSGIAPELPNTTSIVLQDQCPLDTSDHLQTASAVGPTLEADTLNALDPQHPRPIPCVLHPFQG